MTPEELGLAKQAADYLLSETKGFLQKLLGGGVEELGSLITDQVRAFRFNNQIKIVATAKAKLESAGISPRTVPLKLLAPLLEHCSLEDAPELQELWASLLANAADPAEAENVRTEFVEVLKQLTSLDALILYKYGKARCSPYMLADELGMDSKSVTISIENLERLNLIREDTPTLPRTTPTTFGEIELPAISRAGTYQISTYGRAFIEACTRA